MTAVDASEIRARMIEAADALREHATATLVCDRMHGRVVYTLPREATSAMAYAEAMLRTLAATILPPDPVVQQIGGAVRAATAARDEGGRFLSAKAAQ
jgi:hypothetical protein